MSDAQKPKPTPTVTRTPDEPIRVKELRFIATGGVPLPHGLSQQAARLIAGEPPGKPRFEILFAPRMGVYVVRAFAPRTGDGRPGAQTHEFLIPREWAVADLEVLPSS
jgi:hypothetical protein